MALAIELSVVVVAVQDNEAVVLCRNLPRGADGPAFALPSGPFVPKSHRTFDLALKAFVHDQTGFDIGYVEQLYSFGDIGRETVLDGTNIGDDIISVGYLALTNNRAFQAGFDAAWVPFGRFFPWENWRGGGNVPLDRLRTALDTWVAVDDSGVRRPRVETLFPRDFDLWNEERVLDRYELLYDAGLTREARRAKGLPDGDGLSGEPMASDHRRIAATGLARLRGKLKYRPVIFELMPERFTLLELQRSLEALSGISLHKQNFRRALERTGFVTPLGALRDDTGGRPAELHSYNREQFRFSPSLGLSLPRA